MLENAFTSVTVKKIFADFRVLRLPTIIIKVEGKYIRMEFVAIYGNKLTNQSTRNVNKHRKFQIPGICEVCSSIVNGSSFRLCRMASLSKEDSCFESAGIVDNFRCSLCLNVLRKPVQCKKNEHHFCRSCITRHLQQHQNCPTCKEPLSLDQLRPASQLLSSLLSQLKIRCDFHLRGCEKIMKVEELETHQKVSP